MGVFPTRIEDEESRACRGRRSGQLVLFIAGKYLQADGVVGGGFGDHALAFAGFDSCRWFPAGLGGLPGRLFCLRCLPVTAFATCKVQQNDQKEKCRR